MILAVASGKGGTGKTTVSVNLARSFAGEIQLLDCDVEEPNAHLFLGGDIESEEIAGISVPHLSEDLCDGCGECARLCEYHAVACFGTKAMFFPEMCHGCGGCALVCGPKAIREEQRRIGVVQVRTSRQVTLIQGRLDVGMALVPPLIRAVKARLRPNLPAILDAPPGTSCPVVATLRGADFVLLVTEPTPFGLHDLRLAVDVVRRLGIPCGVVVNRAGSGDGSVDAFCRDSSIPILLELPDDRRIAEVYSRGELIVEALPEYRRLFEALLDKLFARYSGKVNA